MGEAILNRCIAEIEEKYQLKITVPLSNSDCDYIVFLIEEQTNVCLGRNTIRRIWDNKYKRFPQDSTLNALVQLLGYKNWQSYKKSITDTGRYKKTKITKFKFKRTFVLVPALIFIIILILFYITKSYRQESSTINSEGIQFGCKVTENTGFPKSVIFNYNIDSCQADSFFIKLNWREDSKEQIYQNSYYHTDMYFRPGFHKARLIANTTVLKTVPVIINSDGWVGIYTLGAEQGDVLLLSRDQIVNNGYMTIKSDTVTYPALKESNLVPLTFMNVKDFGDINLDNCMIETILKIEPSNYPCDVIFFSYQSKNFKNSRIKLAQEGCVSYLNYKFSDIYVSGKNHDLSKLGCDVTQWVKIEIRIENKNVVVYLNQKPVIDTSYTESMDKLQQLQYSFAGAGSVDYIRIKSLEGDILYQDDFDDEY